MGLPNDFIVPIGRTLDWQGPTMPATMQHHVSQAARGMKEAAGLVELFDKGRHYKPQAPILLVGPDGRQPILLIGDGVTEVAELQDMAQAAIADQEEAMSSNSSGRGMDYDSLREKHGKVRREDVDTQIRYAISERIRHHKENPVSDPFRQPQRTLGNIYPMSREAGWHEGEERKEPQNAPV